MRRRKRNRGGMRRNTRCGTGDSPVLVAPPTRAGRPCHDYAFSNLLRASPPRLRDRIQPSLTQTAKMCRNVPCQARIEMRKTNPFWRNRSLSVVAPKVMTRRRAESIVAVHSHAGVSVSPLCQCGPQARAMRLTVMSVFFGRTVSFSMPAPADSARVVRAAISSLSC